MEDVKDFYNKIGKNYEKKTYEKNLSRTNERLEFIYSILNNDTSLKKILDLGCGTGYPIKYLSDRNFDVDGVDFSETMVKESKKLNPKNTILKGDITNLNQIKNQLEKEYDAIISFGTLGYIENTKLALTNMYSLLRDEGKLIVNFRNKLFSLVTFNKFTYDFLINDLFEDIDTVLKDKLVIKLKNHLNINEPNFDSKIGGPSPIFHNPLEIEELLIKLNYKNIKIHYYNYHAGIPMFFKKKEEIDIFNKTSMKLEITNKEGWKSMFLSSAFIVEATK